MPHAQRSEEGQPFDKLKVDGCGEGGQLTAHPPPDQPAQREHLHHCDGEEVGIERLLAGLVPEQAAPRISPQRPAKEREQQQGRFRDAVLPAPRLRLVHPKRRKGDEVDREEGGGDVGGGEEVGRDVRVTQVEQVSTSGLFLFGPSSFACNSRTIS